MSTVVPASLWRQTRIWLVSLSNSKGRLEEILGILSFFKVEKSDKNVFLPNFHNRFGRELTLMNANFERENKARLQLPAQGTE
jgi:hypothetical protein